MKYITPDKLTWLKWISNIIAEDGNKLSIGSLATLSDLNRSIEKYYIQPVGDNTRFG